MIRFIVVMAAMLAIQANLAGVAQGQSASPLDRSVESIKQDIVSVVDCEWSTVTPRRQSCEDRDEVRGSWVAIEMDADGKIAHLSFQPLVVVPVGVDRARNKAIYGETPRTREDQALTIAVIRKVWPEWAASGSWLKTAFKNARKKYFQNSVRVGDTFVYLTETGPVNSDDRFAYIVLTKKTDLTEFKNFPCSDDDQGPGLDNCTDRGGEPRPPNNPVLHPH